MLELKPWSAGDLWVLEAKNLPEMTEHLGGPETREQVLARQERYVAMTDETVGRMFTVHQGAETVGSVGYWHRHWQGEDVYELGWGVLPAHQGRGLATLAVTALVDHLRSRGLHRPLHAYPGVDHPASNAVAGKAGFTLLGVVEFEYPKGSFKQSNDWCLRLP
ncbi:GCN5 family acetyltransferase [Kitasatospora sp. MMS16-BH015]|uniref:GNAT family N-acetyltransferase n=1 Tax=Kitasatospora sp. MMS16-BH015 TaxID=2018025 RepID=UPI000CA15945|nr:GNAT family N-acetyltransferase [Kitasatospora sp. MMS16-BH015]AUG80970.1 GCN5 family acetyltransferase [Kitasatospora sp. MMS16-BH015]